MVNNVGGSNPNLYVDPKNNNNGQQKFVNPPAQQGGYRTDGYAFNMSNTVANGPVPDVKVGLLDKMGITFKDVLQSDENIKRFVAFENGAKTNPQGYLKPDSKDVTATTDLQKKLKMVGYNISVNGQFGNATEQAVIKFKNSVGINDGYLTKNGSYAVSGTVTPQTWAVLNANVAAKLNPNGNVSGSTYVPPVTQSEMKWAKELQGKIANFGYRPSDQERVKYEGIYQRQRVGMQAQGGVFDPTKAAPPTEQEMAWAQDIAHKMKQFGYKPSGAEKTKYQEIYQRVQISKAGNQTPAQQPVAAQPRPQQITQNDVNWAVNLMNKVKGGYQPTAAESQKYEKVYSAMQNGQGPQKKTEVAATQATTPKANVAPTKKELEWASQLEAKVAQGFNPTAEQKAKYTEIFDKYKAKATEGAATSPKATTGKPSNAEMQWASNLEKRVNEQGYQPTQAEVDKYTDIANRQNASQTTATESTEQTEQPAQSSEVSNKSSDPFHGRTVEKFGKIGTAFDQWAKKHPGTSFPRNNVFYANSDGQLVSQSTVNAAAKSGGNYIGNLDLKNAPALYIPGFSAEKAQNYSYVNGKIYNSADLDSNTNLRVANNDAPAAKPRPQVQQTNVAPQESVPQAQDSGRPSDQDLQWAANLEKRVNEQGYQPTQAEVDKYTDIATRLNASQQSQGTSNASAPSVQGGVTKAELDWADALQNKAAQGYTPTAQEMATYTDIYNRSQSATQQPSASTAQNTGSVNIDLSHGDPDLQWALSLLDKVQQGYQPNQSEITKYEQVIAKNQAVPATP